MVTFGCGMSSASTGELAALEALEKALASHGAETPKLAIVFVSVSYADAAAVPAQIRARLGGVPVVGGTSGGRLFDHGSSARQGVSVTLLGGADLEVAIVSAEMGAPDLLETVPAAEEIAREADRSAERGFIHYACLVLAPGIFADGEVLVAAVRKGAGARAQLAGALTGDDLTLDRPAVVVDGELRSDRVVLAGIFTKRPIGIAARHGWRAVGPVRRVTRAEGMFLFRIDRRSALDVWLEDAKRAGASIPADRRDLALYLANHYEIGIAAESSGEWRAREARAADATSSGPESEPDDDRELVARAPFAIRKDGAIQLSASIPEGARVRILHATRADLLRASSDAARLAVERAKGRVCGALVLACSGRLAALGDAFDDEAREIHRIVGAPSGGACVFGEIARNVRDADAFFNTTAVVVAFGA
jgi:hypothetical protein